MTVSVASLALMYNKPLAYVQDAIKRHGITSLPRFRTPDDGLSDFFSDLSSVFFDPNFESGVDSKGKPFFPSRSMTKQEFTAELDLNVIMARFIANDFDPSTLPVSARKAMTGDFTQAPESYHEALTLVVETKQAFMSLPADIRSEFDNDPQRFLDFVYNPENRDKLVEWGIVNPATEDLSTTLARSIQELGDKVVGKSDQLADGSPAPVSSATKPKKDSRHN